jgi:hypothetical protein
MSDESRNRHTLLPDCTPVGLFGQHIHADAVDGDRQLSH